MLHVMGGYFRILGLLGAWWVLHAVVRGLKLEVPRRSLEILTSLERSGSNVSLQKLRSNTNWLTL